MTAPEHPRKPTPKDPQHSAANEPAADEPLVPARDTPPEPTPPIVTPPTSIRPEPEPAAKPGQRSGQKVAALLGSLGALANKVRTEAPRKVREAREKRIAGRCVILTEVNGRQVAIGPYPNDGAARQDGSRVGGAPEVVELLSQTAFFGTHGDERSTLP